jgi:hypothetical protein
MTANLIVCYRFQMAHSMSQVNTINSMEHSSLSLVCETNSKGKRMRTVIDPDHYCNSVRVLCLLGKRCFGAVVRQASHQSRLLQIKWVEFESYSMIPVINLPVSNIARSQNPLRGFNVIGQHYTATYFISPSESISPCPDPPTIVPLKFVPFRSISNTSF